MQQTIDWRLGVSEKIERENKIGKMFDTKDLSRFFESYFAELYTKLDKKNDGKIIFDPGNGEGHLRIDLGYYKKTKISYISEASGITLKGYTENAYKNEQNTTSYIAHVKYRDNLPVIFLENENGKIRGEALPFNVKLIDEKIEDYFDNLLR